ncbi:hypothetical protein ACS0TY_012466 [Phlomoides rotata]
MEDLFYSINGYLLISSIFIILLAKVVVDDLWWRPHKVENHFLMQGIMGPKYQFFLGNLKEIGSLHLKASSQPMPLNHDIVPRVLSFYHHWKNLYGSMFLVWFGSTARLIISDPTLIKEIFFLKSEFFEKIEPPPLVKRIEGDGLLNLKGEKWAYHRKTIQPIFHTQNLKLMLNMMAKIMEEELAKWSEKMCKTGNEEIEVEVCVWFQNLMEKVISRATFGTSYEEGLAIFQVQAQQMVHAVDAYRKIVIPGYRFLPTSQKLDKEIRKSLLKLIDRRRKSKTQVVSGESPTDLLELMINAADESEVGMTENDIVEECKTIFFAGTHTTSSLMTWTTVLLAMHPQWQEQARDEVLRVCGARDLPSKDDIANLKLLGMIINESLRLYPPVVASVRRAKASVNLGGVHIPCGTEVLVPILAVHHDPVQWGDDAHDFNPMRFAVVTAKHPAAAFIPFGSGSRRCIGQNLAVLQAKLAVAMILQRFSLELAASYQHAPSIELLLQPQHGAPIIFQKL